jgi:DNA-binding response OmpR family regulator
VGTPPIRARVVVTDHDPAFLGLLQELLADEGYAAAVPPDLRDPYPFIREYRPDLIVLDLVYREEASILTVLDLLRLDPATAATPVLVCTTTPGALDGLHGREAEGLYVLTKPFDLDQLLGRLKGMLAAHPPAARAAPLRGSSQGRNAHPGRAPAVVQGGTSPQTR